MSTKKINLADGADGADAKSPPQFTFYEKKFCVDCEHHELIDSGKVAYDACSFGDVRDLVTGLKDYPFCSSEREDHGLPTNCGPLAQFFKRA